MLVEHTPSYKAAHPLLPHPQNGICFVGYCDPDTPGGRLLKTQDATFFFEALDYVAPIKASIDQFDLRVCQSRAITEQEVNQSEVDCVDAW